MERSTATAHGNFGRDDGLRCGHTRGEAEFHTWLFTLRRSSGSARKLVPTALAATVQTRPGGSSEREWVSEYLEESPLRLARPLRTKSWDVSSRRATRRRGSRGRGGIARQAQEAHESLDATRSNPLTRKNPCARADVFPLPLVLRKPAVGAQSTDAQVLEVRSPKAWG